MSILYINDTSTVYLLIQIILYGLSMEVIIHATSSILGPFILLTT
jgi:hypothetical protein